VTRRLPHTRAQEHGGSAPGLAQRVPALPTLRHTVDYIASVQRADGAIPWFEAGPVDPWDHVEAAMGLSIGGRISAAERAYQWLTRTQRANGSFWLAGRQGFGGEPGRCESNSTAYIATGVWHHFSITRDHSFLRRMWPTVEAAIEFVLGLQAPRGEICWAVDAADRIQRDALVAGNSCIYKSLGCAIAAGHRLGEPRSRWVFARARVRRAIRRRPECFDRTWASNRRFAMDWYYPVLAGVIRGEEARARLARRWDDFVEAGVGCRCVDDTPWVSVAETCELVLALLTAGEPELAARLFGWLHERFRDDDGGYFTGYAFRDDNLWPRQKSTWTAGVVLMAADALSGVTPAAGLFTGERVRSRVPSPEDPREHDASFLRRDSGRTRTRRLRRAGAVPRVFRGSCD
jgi:hypothetical protein